MAGEFNSYVDYSQAPIYTPGGSPSSVSGGTGSSSSSSSTQMVPGMMGVYSQLLGMNQQNYGNVLNAYSQGQQKLSSGLPGVYSGYGAVNNNVQGILGMGQVLGQNGNWGVAAPAAQAIGQTYAQNMGNTTQQMTNAGLGNTTAVGNAQTQNALSASQAYGGLGAQLAQTAAGYAAQEGNAGLGAQMQGLGLQSGLAGQEGGALAGYHYANTAGSLTGGFSNSSSANKQQSVQQPNAPTNGMGNTQSTGNAPAGYTPGTGYQAPGGVMVGGGGAGSGGGGGGGSGGGGGMGAYNPDTGGGGLSGSVGVMGQVGYNPLNPGGYSIQNFPQNQPTTGVTGNLGAPANTGPNSGFNSQGQLTQAGQNYGGGVGNSQISAADMSQYGASQEAVNNANTMGLATGDINPQEAAQNAAKFGAKGFGPGVPTSPPNEGDGVMKDANGMVIGWSPWGRGGKSGPPI